MARRPSRTRRYLLRKMREDLIEALRRAENEEWHHSPTASETFKVYTSVAAWLSIVQTWLEDLSEDTKDQEVL